MKSYKVKRAYTDRETGEQRNPGDMVQASDERAAELREADVIYATVQADPEPSPETEVTEDAEPGKRTRRKPADPGADSDG